MRVELLIKNSIRSFNKCGLSLEYFDWYKLGEKYQKIPNKARINIKNIKNRKAENKLGTD